MKIALYTPYSPEMCAEKLSRAGHMPSLFNPARGFGGFDKPVDGWVLLPLFCITRTRWYGHGGFCILGMLRRDPVRTGTLITGTYGMGGLPTVWLTVSALGTVVFSVPAALRYALDHVKPHGAEFAPVWFLVLGSLIFGLFRWLSKGDDQFLIAFLKKTLNASEEKKPRKLTADRH